MRLLHLFGHAANAGKKISAPVARTAKAVHETAQEMRTVRTERIRSEKEHALKEGRQKSIAKADDPFESEPETVPQRLGLRAFNMDTDEEDLPTVKPLWVPEPPVVKVISKDSAEPDNGQKTDDHASPTAIDPKSVLHLYSFH